MPPIIFFGLNALKGTTKAPTVDILRLKMRGVPDHSEPMKGMMTTCALFILDVRPPPPHEGVNMLSTVA